jgi:hypothetical protein
MGTLCKRCSITLATVGRWLQAVYRQGVIDKKQAKHCDEYAAAEFLGLSVATLRDWRFRRIGPPFCKFGKAVRYSRLELERYAEACRVPMAA